MSRAPSAPPKVGQRFALHGAACTVCKVRRVGRGWRVTYQHADGKKYTESLRGFLRYFEAVEPIL